MKLPTMGMLLHARETSFRLSTTAQTMMNLKLSAIILVLRHLLRTLLMLSWSTGFSLETSTTSTITLKANKIMEESNE